MYDGAANKIARLGLQPLVDEVASLVTSTRLLVYEEAQANGAAAIRQLLDATFLGAESWQSKKTGDVDWSKCKVVNGTRVCVGVEIQVSARSELLYKDILHLKNRIVPFAREAVNQYLPRRAGFKREGTRGRVVCAAGLCPSNQKPTPVRPLAVARFGGTE